MKKQVTIIMAALTLALIQTASAQLLVDAMYTDPTYIEAGDSVNIYVRFHEEPSTWKLTSVKSVGGEKQPVGKDPDIYYIGRIVPVDDITKEHVLVKKSERDIGFLAYGQTWVTPFEITVEEDAPATIYNMEFQILKTDLQKTKTPEIVLSQRFNITVEGDPKFTLDSDSQLKAGETKDFTVSVSNMGGGIAKHVTVELNATSPLTVLRSSSVYVGDYSGRTTKKIGYELYVDSAASPKAYTIPASIKYTDRNGTTQTISKTLGVKVQGMPIISANLDSFDDLMAGMSGKVTVSVANKGFIDAKFLAIELVDTKDYTVTSNSNVYIGNLASDDFETEDFTVRIADGVSGKIPLKVKVTYTEENNNKVHVEEEDLGLNVLTDGEYYKLHPKSNGTQIISALIAIPALVLAYIVLWALYKIVGLITGYIDRKVFRRT